ncbi:MAG: hypothetical protein Q9181_004752 [Wetmoreana brouardii]
MASPLPNQLGSVLVVGGCGFVGFHVVHHFLMDSTFTSVSVLSRNPRDNRIHGVSYHPGDIADLAQLRHLVHKISPSLIVHTASPSAISATLRAFEEVTISGTRNLLLVASEVPTVKAFIYTSSATIAAGSEHINLEETTSLADTVPNSNPYAKTKAQADKMVLHANRFPETGASTQGLSTACIRLPLVYGERDQISIPGVLAALEKGQAKLQLGDGSNLWDFASANNVGVAHVLLAKALLAQTASTLGIAGEAFNITDGERHYFWDYPRAIWKSAGHEIKQEDIWAVPSWLTLMIADVLEWLFWIFSLGTKRPQKLGRQQAEYFCLTHTYCIDKAKERLGYKPMSNFDEEIGKAVKWSLNEGKWGSRLKKTN